MTRRDPLEDIFGPSASTSAVTTVDTDVVSSTAMHEDEIATQTQRVLARPRRHDGPDNKRPRMSETWRNLFDSGNNEASTLDNGGGPGTQVEESQSRIKKYRLELDEEDRVASQSVSNRRGDEEEFDASQRAESRVVEPTRKRRAISPPKDEFQPAQQRQRQLEEMEEDEVERNSTAPSTIPATAATTSEAPTRTTSTSNDKKGNSDTDTKFLQAMATSKRSKKGLDQFDKEFNLLRLSKPTRVTGRHGKIIADVDDPEYRAWEQMGPSDFDINAAGNFVQVDFVPLVYQRSEEEIQDQERRQSELQGKWNGKPNFKKFRTKQRPRREPIAMDVREGMDYGMGDGYTRPPRPTAKVYEPVQDGEEDEIQEVELVGPPPKPDLSQSKKDHEADPLSDEERSTQSRRSTQTTASRNTQSRQRRQGSKAILTTQEEERNQPQQRPAIDVRLDVDVDLNDSIYQSSRRPTVQPPPPSSTSSSTVKSSKRSLIEQDSDSDDDNDNFSGFRKKRRR